MALIGQPICPGKQAVIHYCTCLCVCMCVRLRDLCAVMSPQTVWTYRLYADKPSLCAHTDSMITHSLCLSPSLFLSTWSDRSIHCVCVGEAINPPKTGVELFPEA